MNRDALIQLSDDELIRRCTVDISRGSGRGGQKRNKTSTAVRVTHPESGISVRSDATRSQHTNKADALKRLRLYLALEVRQPIPDPASRGPSEVLRRWLGIIPPPVGRRSPDHLLAIAELLDILCAHGCSLRESAASLTVSTGALSRAILGEPALGARVNALRAAAGLHPLHK